MAYADEDARPGWDWPQAGARLAVGLAQGFGVYALINTAEHHGWPDKDPALFAGLVIVVAAIPFVLLAGLGRVRPLILALLAATSTAAVFGFIWHNVAWDASRDETHPGPAAPVVLASIALLFVTYHLAAPADAARKWLAPYPLYFDTAWKDGVQLVLSLAFVGVMWAALMLGAQLFSLIGIAAFTVIIKQGWFAFPVSAAAFAVAVQLTDVRLGLIRGIRGVGLVLLGWLLPLMTLITAAFLATLPFTGLAPLFATRSAAEILLAAAAVLILLINAVYQDGRAEKTPTVLGVAARLAGICLIPLIAIAGDALARRVGQYGWTPERIEAAACVVVGAGYALGYAFAAMPSRRGWMKPLEWVNVAMALASALIVVLLLSPLGDPARLSASDQSARLERGALKADAFDFQFLRFKSGAYGRQALARLAALTGDARRQQIASLATDAQRLDYPAQNPAEASLPLEKRVTVYPAGAVIPATFLVAAKDEASAIGPAMKQTFCTPPNDAKCDLYVVDIDGDGRPEVLIGPEAQSDSFAAQIQVFAEGAAGWAVAGDLDLVCKGAIEALRRGQVVFIRRSVVNISLGGHPFQLQTRRPVCDLKGN